MTTKSPISCGNDIIVPSEIKAAVLLKDYAFNSNNLFNYHVAGNMIIQLAEQIKAERSVASMK